MGKDKSDKKGGKSGSRADSRAGGRIKLPKRIGSVKIPKELRKSGEALIESARDTLVRELAVAGIAAMAAGAQRRAANDARPAHPAEPARPRPVEAVVIEPGEPAAPILPEQVIGIVGGAVLNAFCEMAAKRG